MAPKTIAPVTYLFRNIDPTLWARVKARADADGQTIRDALLHLATAYADGDRTLTTTTTTTTTTAARRRK